MLCDTAKEALGLSSRKPISNHLNSARVEFPLIRPNLRKFNSFCQRRIIVVVSQAIGALSKSFLQHLAIPKSLLDRDDP